MLRRPVLRFIQTNTQTGSSCAVYRSAANSSTLRFRAGPPNASYAVCLINHPTRYVSRSYATATTRKSTRKTTTGATATDQTIKKTKAKPKTKKAKKAKKVTKATKGAKPKKSVRKARKTSRVNELTLKSRKVRELKKEALAHQMPKLLPATRYLVYCTEQTGGKGTGHIGDRMRTVAAAYRALSDGEKAQYENTARKNKDMNAERMTTWVSSHSPDTIRLANNARRSLNRMAKEPIPQGRKRALVSGRYKAIADPRQLKRVDTPYIAFARERWASGDYNGIPPTTAVVQISSEYRNLSASELQTLRDRYESDRTRYVEEFNRTFTSKAGLRKKTA